MIRFLRRLVGITTSIRPDEAIRIAHAYAEEKGWPWHEPVRAIEWFTKIHVVTNAGFRGGNVNVWISVRNGRVLHAGFAPR